MNQVSLRALEPEDLDLLYRIENDADLWNVGVTNVPYSRYLLHEYIASSSGDIYKDGQVRLIVEKADGAVVGIADLMNFDAKNRRAEVGIIIEQAHRCRGYASEALRLLADYAHRVLHLHQLYAVIAHDNQASLSLFHGQGYHQTTLLTDWLFDGAVYHDAVVMQKRLEDVDS